MTLAFYFILFVQAAFGIIPLCPPSRLRTSVLHTVPHRTMVGKTTNSIFSMIAILHDDDVRYGVYDSIRQLQLFCYSVMSWLCEKAFWYTGDPVTNAR